MPGPTDKMLHDQRYCDNDLDLTVGSIVKAIKDIQISANFRWLLWCGSQLSQSNPSDYEISLRMALSSMAYEVNFRFQDNN